MGVVTLVMGSFASLRMTAKPDLISTAVNKTDQVRVDFPHVGRLDACCFAPVKVADRVGERRDAGGVGHEIFSRVRPQLRQCRVNGLRNLGNQGDPPTSNRLRHLGQRKFAAQKLATMVGIIAAKSR